MHTLHLKGALLATWLFIIGHLPEISYGVQILAFLGSFAVSVATLVSWFRNLKKDK